MPRFEALVLPEDNVNESLTDDEKERLLYKRGDIIVCRPKGWTWGRKEVRRFKIIELPEMTEEEARALEEPIEAQAVFLDPDSGGEVTEAATIRRRRHRVDLDALLARVEPSAPARATMRMSFADPELEFQPLKDTPCLKAELLDKMGQAAVRETITAEENRMKSKPGRIVK